MESLCLLLMIYTVNLSYFYHLFMVITSFMRTPASTHNVSISYAYNVLSVKSIYKFNLFLLVFSVRQLLLNFTKKKNTKKIQYFHTLLLSPDEDGGI